MMKGIRIADREIGDGNPCFIIAEAGANWRYCDDPEKNFQHALELIDMASKAGADAVKFQVYRAERLYAKDAGHADYIGKKKSIYQTIHEMELPYDWLPQLKEHCDKKKIIFLATPFDEESTDKLEGIGVPTYKIASYTITHLPLLEYIARKRKPVILSTGASNLQDIEEALGCIMDAGNQQIALMQCTAKYPAPLESLNLRVIDALKRRFSIPVGLSDHSREPLIGPLGAVALGANMIEKHFTTDNSLEGPDHGFAVLPGELKEMIDSIRALEGALGKGEKDISEDEKELYRFARRYIYSIKDIPEGEGISPENVSVLRSGNLKPGLEPRHLREVLGKKARKNIKAGTGITWDLLE